MYVLCVRVCLLLVDVFAKAIADSRATILFRILSTAFARRVPCSYIYTYVSPCINDVEIISISISLHCLSIPCHRASYERECCTSSRCNGRLCRVARGEERANKWQYDAQVCGGECTQNPSWKYYRCRDPLLREETVTRIVKCQSAETLLNVAQHNLSHLPLQHTKLYFVDIEISLRISCHIAEYMYVCVCDRETK